MENLEEDFVEILKEDTLIIKEKTIAIPPPKKIHNKPVVLSIDKGNMKVHIGTGQFPVSLLDNLGNEMKVLFSGIYKLPLGFNPVFLSII